MAAALAGAQAYAEKMHRLGNDITLSGLYSALHVEGVQRVELNSPSAAIIIAPHQAPHCPPENITLRHAGTDQ
jgi:phage-related baseplate assembly protein